MNLTNLYDTSVHITASSKSLILSHLRLYIDKNYRVVLKTVTFTLHLTLNYF